MRDDCMKKIEKKLNNYFRLTCTAIIRRRCFFNIKYKSTYLKVLVFIFKINFGLYLYYFFSYQCLKLKNL